MTVGSGIATGGARGKSATLTAKKMPKIGEKSFPLFLSIFPLFSDQENSGKKGGEIGKKWQKSGRFFHFAPPDI